MSPTSESPEQRAPASGRPPSDKQLRYLKNLAAQRGESFTYPQTSAQASAEIERLLGRKRGSYVERRIEREQISRDMAERGDASSVGDSEVEGYGSSARWVGGSGREV